VADRHQQSGLPTYLKITSGPLTRGDIRSASENRTPLVERKSESAGASRRLHPHRRPAMGSRGADRRQRRPVETTLLSEPSLGGNPGRSMAGWSSGVARTGALRVCVSNTQGRSLHRRAAGRAGFGALPGSSARIGTHLIALARPPRSNPRRTDPRWLGQSSRPCRPRRVRLSVTVLHC
jgi:hypothetical protein